MAALRLLLLIPFLLLLLGYVLSRRMTDRHRPDEKRSPAEYGLEFEEVAFPSTDGAPLRGWWVPSAARSGR